MKALELKIEKEAKHRAEEERKRIFLRLINTLDHGAYQYCEDESGKNVRTLFAEAVRAIQIHLEQRYAKEMTESLFDIAVAKTFKKEKTQ